MNRAKTVATVLALGIALAGCSAVDRLTGETDNTVLPGQREEAVPGKPTFRNTDAPQAGQAAPADTVTASEPPPAEPAPCAADDPACQPASDAGDGTFSDPQ